MATFSVLIYSDARMFERGECGYQGLFTGDMVPTFESNIVYTLRFMIDTKVRISSEHKYPHHQFSVRS